MRGTGPVGPPGRRAPRIIHNPVDLSRFDPTGRDQAAARAALGLPADAPIAGVVGQLTPVEPRELAVGAEGAEALVGLVQHGEGVVHRSRGGDGVGVPHVERHDRPHHLFDAAHVSRAGRSRPAGTARTPPR